MVGTRGKIEEDVFRGVAWRRAMPYDSDSAHKLADEIIDDLDQIRGKIRKLEQLGWDQGGQPAFVQCERLVCRSLCADGSPRAKIQKVRPGEVFAATVAGVGPHSQCTYSYEHQPW
eukprot:SAG31_NODE_6_length_43291_cov_191.503496_17_plen_116_part_00